MVGAMFQIGFRFGSGFVVPNRRAMNSGGRKEAYRPHMRQGVDDLVWRARDDFGGRGGSGVQLAIVLTQSRAIALSLIPGKWRRSSTTADNSPLSSNIWRIAAAVVSSTLNMARA
jgi:hypothetical protein